jgi:hypothetical protein
MNWTGYGRKGPKPNARYYPICLDGGKPPKISAKIVGVQARN